VTRLAGSSIVAVSALVLASGCEPILGADFGDYHLGACVPVEDCSTPKDDDCDGKGNQTCGSFIEGWALELTNPATMPADEEVISALVVGPEGAIFASSYRGALALAGDSGGPPQGYIARAPKGGSPKLVTKLKRTNGTLFTDLDRRSDGGYVLAGGYAGAQDSMSDLDMQLPTANDLAVLVARFDANDKLLATFASPGEGEELATDVGVGPNGDVAVVGFSTAKIPNLGIPTDPVNTSRQFFVGKLDEKLAPDPAWGAFLTSGDAESTCGTGLSYQTETSLQVALDAAGSIWITGMFCGSLATQSKTLDGARDFFLLKKSSATEVVGLAVGDGDLETYQVGRVVVPIAGGGAYVAGDFEGTFDPGAGGEPLQSHGGRDLFVMRVDDGLAPLWMRAYGGGRDDLLRDLTVAPDGSLYVTGQFDGETDLGAGPAGAADGVQRVFVLKLDPTGEPIYSHTYGDADMGGKKHGGRRVRVDAAGDVWLAARLEGKLEFGAGAGEKFSTALSSGFIGRFEP
jgi:hypothetical protein